MGVCVRNLNSLSLNAFQCKGGPSCWRRSGVIRTLGLATNGRVRIYEQLVGTGDQPKVFPIHLGLPLEACHSFWPSICLIMSALGHRSERSGFLWPVSPR